MEAILKSIKKRKIPINPVIVISNKPDAKGLEIAEKLGIPTRVVENTNPKGERWEYDQKIIKVLEEFGVTPKKGLICLAGFMRIISPQFVTKYKNKILNIHPALLPAFPGLHVQKQALEYGAKYSGCTVHFVDDGVDTGPIILQAVVKIEDDDTEEALTKRILKQEHKIYPRAIELIARGKIRIKGRRALIN